MDTIVMMTLFSSSASQKTIAITHSWNEKNVLATISRNLNTINQFVANMKRDGFHLKSLPFGFSIQMQNVGGGIIHFTSQYSIKFMPKWKHHSLEAESNFDLSSTFNATFKKPELPRAIQ